MRTIALLFFLASSLLAAKGISSCAVLSSAGETYALSKAVEGKGNCFTISAANITLDCAGFSISGSNIPGSEGVYAKAQGASIRNCAISGFSKAIHFRGVSGGEIRNVNATSDSGGIAIYLESSSKNRVSASFAIAKKQALPSNASAGGGRPGSMAGTGGGAGARAGAGGGGGTGGMAGAGTGEGGSMGGGGQEIGIRLFASSENVLENVVASSDNYVGILVHSNSNRNIFNNVQASTRAGPEACSGAPCGAIHLGQASGNSFKSARAEATRGYAVRIGMGGNNSFSDSALSSAENAAVYIMDSSSNKITGSDLESLSKEAVLLQGSEGNTILGNRLFSNSSQPVLLDEGSTGNIISQNSVLAPGSQKGGAAPDAVMLLLALAALALAAYSFSSGRKSHPAS
jgi:parallel beta-helix repeat protein